MGGSMSAETLMQVPATHTPDGRKITEVAVGVAQRPEGKPYAGYWEFPGGKLEAGESVEAALTRELKEELDITLRTCVPWHTIEHDYPHAYVRLHFCKVTAWEGTLRALEEQDFAWQTLPITVDPVLPATLPVFEWMRAESAAAPAQSN
jgi:8-oxo-dGTP diphosphatase